MFKTHYKDIEKNGAVLVGLSEKIGKLALHKHYYYKDNEYIDLAIGSSVDYKKLLRCVLRNYEDLNLMQISSFVLSISEIHKRELGYFFPGLYKAIQVQTLKRYNEELQILQQMINQKIQIASNEQGSKDEISEVVPID